MHPTQSNHSLPYLDGWRGLAICLLLLGHFFPLAGINFGAVGVNLFFVLSGLLMARLLFVDRVPFARFYKRRVSRIFPAVFFFLAAVVAAYLAIGRPVNWSEVGFAATFLNNYFPGRPGAADMPFGHIWSLCVEEHSYVALSLVALLVRRTGLNAAAAVGVLALLFAGCGIGYWASYHGEHLEFERWLRSEVMAYAIFASAFLFLLFHGRRMPATPWWSVPLLLALGVTLHWWSVPAPLRTIAGTGAFALAINLLANAPQRLHALFAFRPLRQMGLWSFSIYLWQQPFYLLTHRSGLPPAAAMALAIMAGIASFYLLEQPMRVYLNRKWTPPQTADEKKPLPGERLTGNG